MSTISKSDREIAIMRQAGGIVATILEDTIATADGEAEVLTIV